MKAAIYTRISTHEGRQFTDNQRRETYEFVTRRGWKLADEYTDESSGGRGDRAGIKALLEGAHARRFDVVVVWALDRFTREGIPKAFEYIHQLKAAGVEFVSVTEPQFSTSGPHQELFIALAAWMARMERERIQERIRAGLRRAKEAGRRSGPKYRVWDVAAARRMRADGMSWRKIAAKLNVPLPTVRRRVK